MLEFSTRPDFFDEGSGIPLALCYSLIALKGLELSLYLRK